MVPPVVPKGIEGENSKSWSYQFTLNKGKKFFLGARVTPSLAPKSKCTKFLHNIKIIS